MREYEAKGCKDLQIRAGEEGCNRDSEQRSMIMDGEVCTRTDCQASVQYHWQVMAHTVLPSPTTKGTRGSETDEMCP